MISLEEWLELINYQVNHGSDVKWETFGPNAYYMNSYKDDTDIGIIFDTETRDVYEVTVSDKKNRRAYRLIDPNYVEAYKKSVIDSAFGNVAFDEVEYTDLEVHEDWLEKAEAILNDQPYSADIKITLDIDDDTLFILFKKAHEANMSFNEYVNRVLQEEMDRIEQEKK